MLRSTKEMKGYTVHARDGEIGSVSEFLFDGDTWDIRYLVVNIGEWLLRKQTLISPQALKEPTPTEITVNLSQEQIKESPEIATDKPVSMREEQKLFKYYGWSPYWSPTFPSIAPTATEFSNEAVQLMKEENESEPKNNLRSTKGILGYHIHAQDEHFGHIDDIAIDTTDWTLRYLVINTGNWFSGKKVLVSTSWVSTISWLDKAISTSLKADEIRNAPSFDPDQPINRETEEMLFDFYGRPKYWIQEPVTRNH